MTDSGWGFKPETLAEAAKLVSLPDDAIAECGITVISYLDPAGGEMFGFQTHGDPTMSKLAGLLAMTSHRLIHLANPSPCEEEDE